MGSKYCYEHALKKEVKIKDLLMKALIESVIRSGLLPDGNQTLNRGREGNNGARTPAEVLKERNRRKGLQRSGRRVAEGHGGIKDDVRIKKQQEGGRRHGKHGNN